MITTAGSVSNSREDAGAMRPGEGGRSAYIVAPVYDWLFFLLPPALSLLLGILVSGTDFAEAPFTLRGEEYTWEELVISTLIHAHLVAVFVRSHGNRAMFPRYPVRFLVVPLVLWLLITTSTWLGVTASVLATFWDVWHSGLQTFGLGRIYDRNAGNPPEAGRRLDYWMNQLLYAGPILAGATMLDHFGDFEEFERVGATHLVAVTDFMVRTQSFWTWAVVGVGTLYAVIYVAAYWRLHRRGYRVSFLKVFLIASTGLCSIYTWGFNRFDEAFFIMNLFHAVQYLALVWASEKRQILGRLRLAGRRHGEALAVGLFLGMALAYGGAAQFVGDRGALWAITVTVSLLHFWYDGFIWSVRRHEV
jgi:hypothetical protein